MGNSYHMREIMNGRTMYLYTKALQQINQALEVFRYFVEKPFRKCAFCDLVCLFFDVFRYRLRADSKLEQPLNPQPYPR